MIGEFIIAHLVGDYLLQNDFLATGKKEKSWICLLHAVLYTLPFLLVLAANTPPSFTWAAFLLLVVLQHFLQDRWSFVVWWMNKIGQSNFAKPPCGPWSIFVVDNSLHLLWVLVLYWTLLR